MNKVIIRNDFANTEITVDTSKPLTRKKIKTWRSKMHSASCTSGDNLGGRGKQADQAAYDALLLRAYYVVASGNDEQKSKNS